MNSRTPLCRNTLAHLVRSLILAAVLLCTPWPAHAIQDWNQVGDPLRGGLGLHVGKVGGVGLAYKYPLQWWLQLQIAGGIWHAGDHERHNFGLELHYILRQDAKLRLYLAGGLGFFHHKQRKERLDGTTYWAAPDDVTNSGLGVGLEWLRTDRVSIQFEGNFTHEGDDGDFFFLPQLAVFFYF